MTLTRRHALLATAALAAAPGGARAQAKPNIAVRIDRDVEVLDPAFRSGLQDGNIIRAVFQRCTPCPLAGSWCRTPPPT